MTMKIQKWAVLLLFLLLIALLLISESPLVFLPPLNLRSWELYHPLFPFRNLILSALFVLLKMHEIGIYPITISPLLFSVRKSGVRNKKKEKTTNRISR